MNTANETIETDAEQDAQAEMDAIAGQLQEEFDRLENDTQAETPELMTLHKYVRLRTRYAAEAARVKGQMAAMLRGLQSRIDGLDYLFDAIAQDTTRKLLAGGKAKSLKTPYGTVGFRTKAALLEVVDEEAVLMARAEGKLPEGVVKTKTEIVKSALNEHFKSSGEIPPGCDVRPESESFYIK